LSLKSAIGVCHVCQSLGWHEVLGAHSTGQGPVCSTGIRAILAHSAKMAQQYKVW